MVKKSSVSFTQTQAVITQWQTENVNRYISTDVKQWYQTLNYDKKRKKYTIKRRKEGKGLDQRKISKAVR